MKHGMFLIMLICSAAAYTGCDIKDRQSGDKAKTVQTRHEDPEGYYTCPMHPQVHAHQPGRCPICSMPLTKVAPKGAPENAQARDLHVTDSQLHLAGIGRHEVGRKDLVFTMAVSGRLVSSENVVFQVYESDLQLVRVGLEFSGRAAASPDEVLTGRIRRIDSLIDPSSRTVRVSGALSHRPKNLVIDGAFHGEIRAEAKNQIAIPEQAVLHTGERDLVYLFTEDNRLKPHAVILGKKAKQDYQVLSGLSEGDRISSGPNFLLDSEAKIRDGSDQTHH